MDSKNMLYTTDNVRIYIDNHVPCMVNEWDGFIRSVDFRDAILKLVELLGEHSPQYGTLNMLADTRKLQVIAPKDLEWIQQEINPLYVKNGASYEAFVLPEDVFGQHAIDKYIEMTTSEGMFTVCNFDSLDKARTWLKEVHSR